MRLVIRINAVRIPSKKLRLNMFFKNKDPKIMSYSFPTPSSSRNVQEDHRGKYFLDTGFTTSTYMIKAYTFYNVP